MGKDPEHRGSSVSIRQLTRAEYTTWHSRWQKTFARLADEELGTWTVDGTDASVFESRFMPRLRRGGRAELEYAGAPARRLVLLFKEGKQRFGELWDLGGAEKPSVGRLKELTARGDFHVFPDDLSWAAYFHHEEDWMSVCFTYRDDAAEQGDG